MTTVWFLYDTDYEDKSVVGVYSTKKLALLAKKAFDCPHGGPEEVEMDQYEAELRSGACPWRVEMLSTGEVVVVHSTRLMYGTTLGFSTWQRSTPHQPTTYHIQGVVWAKTRDEAIEAVDAVRKQQVEQGWGKA